MQTLIIGGLVTLVLLVITAIIPVLGQKGIIKNHYKIHVILARIVIALAVLHGLYGLSIYLGII